MIKEQDKILIVKFTTLAILCHFRFVTPVKHSWLIPIHPSAWAAANGGTQLQGAPFTS